jgi:hypothetical protein
MVQPSPNAEKKRARSSGSRRPIREALLKPTTWRAAILALEFFLKLGRVVAKVWDILV